MENSRNIDLIKIAEQAMRWRIRYANSEFSQEIRSFVADAFDKYNIDESLLPKQDSCFLKSLIDTFTTLISVKPDWSIEDPLTMAYVYIDHFLWQIHALEGQIAVCHSGCLDLFAHTCMAKYGMMPAVVPVPQTLDPDLINTFSIVADSDFSSAMSLICQLIAILSIQLSALNNLR